MRGYNTILRNYFIKFVKKIVIIGRENVGKSTLFNKLCNREISITNDQPSVTRDYIKYTGVIFGIKCELIDTAGWHFIKKETLKIKIQSFIEKIINQADIIFFVVDAKTLLTDEDIEFAKIIRKTEIQTILLANKSESKIILSQRDLKNLGLGSPIFISAEHKIGFDKIHTMLSSHSSETISYSKEHCDSISIAIIGRQNVGKSTLFNAILGFERSIVSNIKGTTRDYITHRLKIHGIEINLIDTAGIRKKTKIQEKIEELSVNKTISTIRHSDIILLVMDSENVLERQDLILANLVLKNNKLLIPIINKQDLISNLLTFRQTINRLLASKLPQIKDIATVFTSSQNKVNKNYIFKHIIHLWKLYSIRIPTSKLNNWLIDTLKMYHMPITKNNVRLKIKYVKQYSCRPPTYVFFLNTISNIGISRNFKIFLLNSLRARFNLKGIPITIHFVTSKNPYIINKDI